MKKDRIIVFALIFFILPATLIAQIKKIDDSGKKPEWVKNAIAKNYIIGIGSGPEIDKAKKKAMLDVKKQITESVAVQIKSVSKSMISEEVHNEQSNISSDFTQVTESRTAKRDYLYGISSSKVDDFYWQHIKNKKTNKKYFQYWVRYPFSKMEQRRLVQEFREKDRKLTKLLNEYLAITESFSSVEELENCMVQLEKLGSVFIDSRKNKAEAGVETCKGLLKSTYITDEGSQPGKVKYSLQIGDKTVTTSKKPRIQSNCAEIQNRFLGKKINEITYSDEYCYEEPGNHVEVQYRINNKHISKKFPLDATAGKTKIKLNGNITLLPDDGNIRLKIHSEYDTPVEITTLELNNDVLGLALHEEVEHQITEKGKHNITLSVKPFEIRDGYTSAEVNGYIYYQSTESKEQKSLRIYRHKATVSR